AFDVVGRVRLFEDIGITFDHPLDDVDLLKRLRDGSMIFPRFRGYVRRPELGSQSALPQTRNIGVRAWLWLTDIELVERAVFLFSELPGQIVMAIDQQAAVMDFEGFVGQLHGLALHGLFLTVLGLIGPREGR